MKGLARDGQGAGGGREDAGEKAQERALPLATFAPEQYRFPGLQAQIERVEGGGRSPGPAKAEGLTMNEGPRGALGWVLGICSQG
jgi:hypothetical protein